MVAVSVLCAPTDEEARWLAGPSALATVQLRTGRLGPLATPEQAAAYRYSEAEAALVAETTATHLIGDPATVVAGLDALVDRTGADEVMLSTRAHSYEARVRSLALVAEATALAPVTAPAG
jgi:alkanesulfonate monooxygenase SsuD/methylene tetrahydromethanopterin reductase-like flavin-dependent oxidoreductase (luciferase family)